MSAIQPLQSSREMPNVFLASRRNAREQRIAEASVLMQSFARGWIAQAQLRQLREEWTAEQREIKLAEFRIVQQQLLLRSIVQAWRGYAHHKVLEREGLSRTKALAHYRRSILFKSWTTWNLRRVEYRRQRQLLARAIGHSRHRVKSRAVNAWRGLTDLALWQRGYLVKVFLTCVNLDAHNSTAMQERVLLAKRHHSLKLLRLPFDILNILSRRAAAKLKKAETWHASRWRSRTPRLVFNTWRCRAEQFRRSRRARALADGAVDQLNARLVPVQLLTVFTFMSVKGVDFVAYFVMREIVHLLGSTKLLPHRTCVGFDITAASPRG